MTKVTAQLNNIRISPRKVRLVADRIRGIDVNDAIALLKYDMRKTAQPMEKLLKSAVANAENNFKLKSGDLVVTDITVGEGPTLKRWMPRAYGRASQILKRTSRINVVLSEKTEKAAKEKKSVTNKPKKQGASTSSTSAASTADKKKVADKKSK